MKSHVFERGDRLYLIGPVSPFQPDSAEIEEYAFAEELKKAAPNPNFLWLRGNYVEADNPNQNGHVWTAGELQIKSLTPMYCPVTVMHNPREVVGIIADTTLKTPEADKVPHSRIETALAIWAHRFPEIAEEIAHNYEAGTLMQSMECQAPYYACAECGQTFHKLPDGAEEKNWCAHLSESANASRILGGVTFTGTGLIFGSRGIAGAYREAHLEVELQEEIAAAHQELHTGNGHTPRKDRTEENVIPMEKMEITRSEYDALQARPKQEDLAAAEKRAEEAETKLAEADKARDESEVAKKKAEDEKAELQKKVDAAEEEEKARDLSSERVGKLGKGFKSALPETVAERLTGQAGKLNDDEWEARVKELEDLTEVKRDDAGDGEEEEDKETASTGSPDLSREEVAAARVGSSRSGGDGKAPSEAARGTVVRGLMRTKTPAGSDK